MDDSASVDRDVTIFTSAVSDDASQEYIGRWNRLVSTTNWEKGRIISQWRQTLLGANAAVVEYSDEAWCLRVGGVTGQHVGRLRRVYERFADGYQKYPGLYWSHFQAALDWPDAEMWLEGAVQNSWSVTAMRQMRFETLGQVGQVSAQETILDAVDDDVEELSDPSNGSRSEQASALHDGPRLEGPDFGDEPESTSHALATPADPFADGAAEPIRPFEHLPRLPEDLSEAFEQFKLAILRHKTAGWVEVSSQALLQSLEALKVLALAPSDSAGA